MPVGMAGNIGRAKAKRGEWQAVSTRLLPYFILEVRAVLGPTYRQYSVISNSFALETHLTGYITSTHFF